MTLLNIIKRLATGKPTEDQIYMIVQAGPDTYVHNWKEIDRLCVETAVVFLREERSKHFYEMWGQARSWTHRLQFELFKLDHPEVIKVREEFQNQAGLADSIMLTMLKHNKANECVDTLVQKYLKKDERQRWLEQNKAEIYDDIDDQWSEIAKVLEPPQD